MVDGPEKVHRSKHGPERRQVEHAKTLAILIAEQSDVSNHANRAHFDQAPDPWVKVRERIARG